MVIDNIIRYLSHLDGVEATHTHESGSYYFKAPSVKIRVSNHLSTSCNPTTTLNIMCDETTDSFCVLYGNRIVPIRTYAKLREFLRNFVMVCDVLAPLADIRQKVKVVEKPVGKPSNNDPDWVYVGDLKPQHREGIRRNVANVKKICHYK